VDEVLIYPRRRTALVAVVLLGVFVAWAAVILYDHHGLHHIGYSDGKLLVFAPFALFVFLNNVRQINSGLPRLRISNDGIEGRFRARGMASSFALRSSSMSANGSFASRGTAGGARAPRSEPGRELRR
jgi:hypothetical protein